MNTVFFKNKLFFFIQMQILRNQNLEIIFRFSRGKRNLIILSRFT